MTDKKVKVGNRTIGPGEQIFFIAEIGINHNGSLKMAKDLVEVAANCDCDAAKFQTFTAKALYIPKEYSGNYKLMGKDISIYDLHVGLEMPVEWIGELNDYCKQHDIIFFSTPVEPRGLEELHKIGTPAYKISSYDLTNIPFVKTVASKGRPVIFSTGAASISEVEECVQAIGSTPMAMMHCVAKYPAQMEYANLAIMDTLKLAFGAPVGFSDNGFVDENGNIDQGIVPISAAKRGADLFEIHITLDRKLPGPDHGFATEPNELKGMVKEMRVARDGYNAGKRMEVPGKLIGSSVRRTYDIEGYVRNFAYKCIFSTKPIKRGEELTGENIAVLRPGAYPERGLEPKYYDTIIGVCATKDIAPWTPIQWGHILMRQK